MLPRLPSFLSGLSAFLPRVSAGFLPTLTGLAGGLLGGGGGGAAAPVPINSTTTFGPVSFGPKYVGDEAVRAAPVVTTASTPSGAWSRVIPWIVGGVVAVVGLVLFARRK